MSRAAASFAGDNRAIFTLNFRADQFKPIALLILVAFLSMAAGVAFWRWSESAPGGALKSLVVLPEPRVIADFRLVDQDGAPFSLDDLRGAWSLMFFGFTHCPDVCPSALYDLEQIHKRLQAAGPALAAHQVVFVSVDPERDSPARMKNYVSYFDPDFIGVSGERVQLLPLTRQLGVAWRIEGHEPGSQDYTVDHSASVFLVNPQGRLYGVFPAPLDPEKMSADLLEVLG